MSAAYNKSDGKLGSPRSSDAGLCEDLAEERNLSRAGSVSRQDKRDAEPASKRLEPGVRSPARTRSAGSESMDYIRAPSAHLPAASRHPAELQEALEQRLMHMDAKLDLLVAQSERSQLFGRTGYFNDIPPVTHGRSGSNSDPGFSHIHSLAHSQSRNSGSVISKRVSHAADKESSMGADDGAQRVKSFYSSDSSLGLFVDAVLERRWMHRSKCVQKIWTFLEEVDSSMAAYLYMRAMLALIFVSVCFPVIQSSDPPLATHVVGVAVETFFDTVFMVEVLIRWAVCPSKYGFLRSPYNILDLCVAGPWLLRLCIDEESELRFVLLAVVPLLRLLKAMRTLPSLRLLYHAISRSLSELTLPLFMLVALTLVFSTLVFFAEPRSNIRTLPQAMWLVIITVSTVGYGDVVPISDVGRAVCAVLAVIGVLFMVPLTIVGQAFTTTWLQREQIVLISIFRQRLMQWGFTNDHVLAMCTRFDADSSGNLDLDEFTRLILKMRLGLSARSTWKLFKTFDVDNSGAIDFHILLDKVYPRRRPFSPESRNRDRMEEQRWSRLLWQRPSVPGSTGFLGLCGAIPKVSSSAVGSA